MRTTYWLAISRNLNQTNLWLVHVIFYKATVFQSNSNQNHVDGVFANQNHSTPKMCFHKRTRVSKKLFTIYTSPVSDAKLQTSFFTDSIVMTTDAELYNKYILKKFLIYLFSHFKSPISVLVQQMCNFILYIHVNIN